MTNNRRYVLVRDDNREVELTMAEAFALETSDYIIPAPSTNEVWRFKTALPNEDDDVIYVLEDFRRVGS